jgi:predicted permease
MRLWQQDLRFSLRLLVRHKGLSAIMVLTFAIGIGATTSVFSVVNRILLRPLPYSEPEKLVLAWAAGNVPKGVFLLVQQKNLRTMESIAAFGPSGFNLIDEGEAERLDGSLVSANFFLVLGGPRPQIGRTFQAGEDRVGQDRIAIISHRLWQRRFHAAPNVIGQTIILDGAGYQIVGVMPKEFRFPSADVQLWVPLHVDPANAIDLWGINSLAMIGRLRAGATPQQATAEIRSIVPQLRKSFPWPMPNEWGSTTSVISLQQYIVGDFRAKVIVLFAAVILLLLVSCANMGNLLLSRALGRQREIAARLALGASRARILAQLLTESIVIAVCGGAVGLLLAIAGTSLLKTMLPANTPYLQEIGVDGRVLLFTFLVSAISGVLFGLAPALQAMRSNVGDVLKSSGSRVTFGRRQQQMQSALVCGEITLSLVLIIAAGLMVKTLWKLEQVKVGFVPQHVLSARINLNRSNCKNPDKCVVFYDELLSSIRSLPGTTKAAVVNGLPLSGGVFPFPIEVEGSPTVSGTAPPTATQYVVTPEYFSTMQIPIVRGRTFDSQDQPQNAGVVIVSASMANHFWPGQDAVGKHLRPVWQPQWRTIIGVVDDVKSYAVGDAPGWAPEWAVYIPYTQSGTYGESSFPSTMTLVVRTAEAPSGYAGLLRSALTSLDATVPMSNIRTMEELLSTAVSAPKSLMSLLIVFAAIALVLGIIGIYGVLAFAVRSRAAELGMRVALGAQPKDLAFMVLRQAISLTLVGAIIGLAAAALLMQVLRGILFGVAPLDPATFIIAPVLMLAAALIASYVPARRASSLDPIKALRTE